MKALILFFIYMSGASFGYRDEVFPINRPPKPGWKIDSRDKRGPEVPGERTTVFYTTPKMHEFSTMENIVITGKDLQEVLNIDHGKYEKSTFDYTNYQHNLYREGHLAPYTFFCIEQLNKCQETMPNPIEVCAYNHPRLHWHRAGYVGYFTGTFCEVHFDNCRRGYRVWRILDVGHCRFFYNNATDDVYHPRRRAYQSILLTKLKQSVSQLNYNNYY